MRHRCEAADARQRLDGDPGRGVHAEIERDEPRFLQYFGRQRLQREIEAIDREARALEQRRGLG